MATNAPTPSATYQALRFLAIGAILASLLLTIWWTNRLADHLEAQRSLLLQIQRDVLVNQTQVAAVLASTDQNGRRLSTVEDRVASGSDDRRQMRAMDQELLEAIVNLRAALHPVPAPAPRPRHE
jgi:hypothetical protein